MSVRSCVCASRQLGWCTHAGDKENLAWAANGAQPQSAAGSRQRGAAVLMAEPWTDSERSGADKWSGVRHLCLRPHPLHIKLRFTFPVAQSSTRLMDGNVPTQQGKRRRDEESEDLDKALLLSRRDSAGMEGSPAVAALGSSSDLAAAAMVDITRPDDADDVLLQRARAGRHSAVWVPSVSQHCAKAHSSLVANAPFLSHAALLPALTPVLTLPA